MLRALMLLQLGSGAVRAGAAPAALASAASSLLLSFDPALQWQRRQQQHSTAAPDGSSRSPFEQQQQQHEQQQQQQQQSQHEQPQTQLQQQLQQEQQAPPRRPVLPTHLILKAIRDTAAVQPLNSHMLFQHVQQEYNTPFRSRSEFKQNLHALQRKKLVAAVGSSGGAPARKKSKGSTEHFATDLWVYVPTREGAKVDVYETGSAVEKAARAAANYWTRQHLPAYTRHLQEGRLPVTPDNMDLLEPQQAWQRLSEQAGSDNQPSHARGSSRQGS